MRYSDKIDNVHKDSAVPSHDKQIHDTKHDEIMIWLYKKLTTDLEFARQQFRIRDDITMTSCNVKIRAF